LGAARPRKGRVSKSRRLPSEPRVEISPRSNLCAGPQARRSARIGPPSPGDEPRRFCEGEGGTLAVSPASHPLGRAPARVAQALRFSLGLRLSLGLQPRVVLLVVPGMHAAGKPDRTAAGWGAQGCDHVHIAVSRYRLFHGKPRIRKCPVKIAGAVNWSVPPAADIGEHQPRRDRTYSEATNATHRTSLETRHAEGDAGSHLPSGPRHTLVLAGGSSQPVSTPARADI
jgi:hypothetical protein